MSDNDRPQPITLNNPLTVDKLRSGDEVGWCAETFCRLWQPGSEYILEELVRAHIEKTGKPYSRSAAFRRRVGIIISTTFCNQLEEWDFDQYARLSPGREYWAKRQLMEGIAFTFEYLLHVAHPSDSIEATRQLIEQHGGTNGMIRAFRDRNKNLTTPTPEMQRILDVMEHESSYTAQNLSAILKMKEPLLLRLLVQMAKMGFIKEVRLWERYD